MKKKSKEQKKIFSFLLMVIGGFSIYFSTIFFGQTSKDYFDCILWYKGSLFDVFNLAFGALFVLIGATMIAYGFSSLLGIVISKLYRPVKTAKKDDEV